MRKYRALLVGAAALSSSLLAACTEPDDTLTVFAAASLNEPFQQIGESFTEQTGVKVEFNAAGSSGLIDQLENGSPGDVLATADKATMDRAGQSELLEGKPMIFAQNHMVIVTPKGNPAEIEEIADLADAPSVTLCAELVPCGAAAERVLGSSGVDLSPASEELSVTDVLGRVRSGEADAGLVYTTSAQQASGDVEIILIDGAASDPNSYPASVLQDAALPEEARLFVDFLFAEESQQVLDEAGFTRVDGP